MQGHVGKELPLVENVKAGVRAQKLDIRGGDVGVLAQAEGDDPAVDILHHVHGVRIVQIRHDIAVRRDALREEMEGVLYVVQILEEVQMVGLHVQDDRDGGMEGEEGVVVLAGLHDDGAAVAHAVSRLEKRQRAADHDGGVLVGGHHDVRAHGGGGRLAVGAADAQGVCVVLGDRAPGLGALKDRDALFVGGDDLGIVVMHGGGAHDKLHIFGDVFGAVPDKDGNPLAAQALDVCALVHIGAGDHKPHAGQHLRQR